MSDIERILKEVIEEADNRLLEEETGEEEHTFSPEFERRIEELKERFFENGKYVGDKYAKPRRSLVIMRRIAACLCVLVLSTAMVVTIRAYGGEVVDWIVSIGSTSTDINFEIIDYDAVPATIEKKYTLAELPEGYELMSEMGNDVSNTITMKNDTGDVLKLSQYSCHYFRSSYDTENAEWLITEVNGRKGYYVNKTGAIQIIWENGEYCFVIKSTSGIDYEQLLKLAESLKIAE